ncbi:MAG: tRNA (adenosine(37)-N6)-threonylcarbamoyltransferase complex ATPase subunit type 1 TsaE [Devosiaceae bacterium]|nr:tRNA (adenosine(37)-N6)-threonylcarbamoyltransferase complex ATPase subunit type 1 TsaE [Devosiaceae bacterium]
MSKPKPFCVFTKDENETVLLAKLLARHINHGDLVLLNGPLGAGKSALVRAMIKSLLNQPDLEVPSPTFLLVLPYQNEKISILHADLYRFEHEEEIEELGLFDNPDAIIFVEWPERVPWLMQKADIIISLQFGPDNRGRQIEIFAPKKPKLIANSIRVITND